MTTTDYAEPLICIGPMDRIVALWFVGFRRVDWLCTMWRKEDGSLHALYRFRYYVDQEAFASDDRKSSYRVEAPASEPVENLISALQLIHDLIATCSPFGEPQCDDTFMRPDGATAEEFFNWADSREWFHGKTLPITGNA